jgi:hypothetical protein
VTPIVVFAQRIRDAHAAGTTVEEIAQSLHVDSVGHVANVRLDFKLVYGEQTLYGTDFINLVRRDGAWRITQKIYDVTGTE